MFRYEPQAEFRCQERSRPDPGHRGIRIVEPTYFLHPGAGAAPVELSPGFGEAIAAGLDRRPEPMGRAGDRYWWIFRDRVYSTPDRLSRSAVLRLAERERLASSAAPPPSAPLSPALSGPGALVS